jgi:hypothetical protein
LIDELHLAAGASPVSNSAHFGSRWMIAASTRGVQVSKVRRAHDATLEAGMLLLPRVCIRYTVRTMMVPAGFALAALSLPTMADAQPIVRARVSGTVFDSVSMTPLSGALVRLVRADTPSVGRSATSDAAGRFVYDTVPDGVWLATFLHPMLDSLRLEPGVTRLEIADPSAVLMPLATPSGPTLFASQCGGGHPAESGVINGEVRGADDDAPLIGATVQVEWPEWVLQKGAVVTELARKAAVTDSAGRFRLCGAPAGSRLRALSWRGADSTGLIEIDTPRGGYAVQDFLLGGSAAMPAGLAGLAADSTRQDTTSRGDARDAATSNATGTDDVSLLRRGRAVVRGVVTSTDGRPLPNAIVRVMGSGTPVRSAADGSFVIGDAAAGTYSVEARVIGYSPHRVPVTLRQAEPAQVALRLAVANVQLDTVRVVAGRGIPYEVQGIERRWRTGVGKVLNADAIRERATMFVTDALRGLPGVFVRGVGGWGQAVRMRSIGGGECTAITFVDGVFTPTGGAGGITLDDFVPMSNVAAIEVYPRAALVPVEFSTMSQCGVVAVWTKFATSNVRILPPKSERGKR